MDSPQSRGESSLELLAAPIHTHPAQLGLQQPGIDHLVQLLSPLGEKKGEGLRLLW